MARLTLERKQWFEYPNDPDKAELEIKHLKPGVLQEIESKVNKIVGKMAEGDLGFTTELDIQPQIRREEIVKAAICGWKGFFNISGEETPCTDINKLKYLQELDDLYEVVEKMRADLTAVVEVEEDGAGPN